MSRTNPRTNHWATAIPLVLFAAGTARAQNSGGVPARILPWNRVQEIVQHFEEICPQPPPLETVLLGTFDAATGDFIWGPTFQLWEVPADVHYDDLAFGPAFELRGILPVAVDLAPQVVGLASVGISPQMALNSANAAPRPKPGHGSGKPGSKVDTNALPVALAGQRFRGHPLLGGAMRTFVRAAKLAFVVEVVNRAPDQTVVLSIDGSTAQASADLIDVIVPPRTRHGFEVRCGAKSFTDRLFVSRPPLIGTFTLEALPVTIVYEPPGGSGCTQTYTSVHRVGTEIRSFQTTDSSSTEAVDTPISTLEDYCEIAKTVGGAAQSVPNPYVAGAGTVVAGGASVLEAAFGSLSVNQEVSSTVTGTHTLTLELQEGSSTTTSEGLGPGQGDAFYILVKPTFAWIVAQDYTSGAVYVSTALLGQYGVSRQAAYKLREHVMAEPPAEMQDLLLALDPLAPEYVSPTNLKNLGHFSLHDRFGSPPRLVPLATPMVSISGASGSFWLSHTLTTSDEHAQIDVTTTTTKSTAGFLSYVTSGVPKDEDSRISLKQGHSSMTSTSDTVEVRVDLALQPGDDGLVMEVSYDWLFGTFGFKELETQAQFMSGTVSDGSGTPLADEPMLLTFADGRSMQASTDKQGKFSIRPPLKVAGPILLRSGGARTTVDWTGTARTGVELRGAVAQAASGKGKPGKTRSGGSRFPDPSTVPVKASEGDTATAIRGRPATGGSRREPELLAEIDRLEKKVQELKTRLAALEDGAAKVKDDAPAGKVAPAGARKSKSAGPVEIVVDPAMRGRLGRMIVQFPEEATVPSCPIEVFNGKTSAASSYGSLSKDLMPGEYAVEIQNRRLEKIEVRTGHVTRIHVGVLRLQGDKSAAFEIFEPGAKKPFFNCYGPQDVGLPPGEVEVGLAGQRAKVVVVADEIVEF